MTATTSKRSQSLLAKVERPWRRDTASGSQSGRRGLFREVERAMPRAPVIPCACLAQSAWRKPGIAAHTGSAYANGPSTATTTTAFAVAAQQPPCASTQS